MRTICRARRAYEHCCIDRSGVAAYTPRAKPEEVSQSEDVRYGTRLQNPSGGTHSMMRGMAKAFLAMAAVLILMPAVAFAQEGQIAGTVRDTSGALMPGGLSLIHI